MRISAVGILLGDGTVAAVDDEFRPFFDALRPTPRLGVFFRAKVFGRAVGTRFLHCPAAVNRRYHVVRLRGLTFGHASDITTSRPAHSRSERSSHNGVCGIRYVLLRVKGAGGVSPATLGSWQSASAPEPKPGPRRPHSGYKIDQSQRQTCKWHRSTWQLSHYCLVHFAEARRC